MVVIHLRLKNFDGPQNLFWRIPRTGSLPKIVASSNLKILPQICTKENALFIHKRYSVGELKVYCHLKFNPIEAESVMVHNAQNLQVRFGSSNVDTFLSSTHKKHMGDERRTFWHLFSSKTQIYLPHPFQKICISQLSLRHNKLHSIQWGT